MFEISACPVAQDKQIFICTSNFLTIFHYFTSHNVSRHHKGKQVFQANFEHCIRAQTMIFFYIAMLMVKKHCDFTSSTCACVCCSLLLCWAGWGGPGGPPGPPGTPDLKTQNQKKYKYHVSKFTTVSG